MTFMSCDRDTIVTLFAKMSHKININDRLTSHEAKALPYSRVPILNVTQGIDLPSKVRRIDFACTVVQYGS